MMQKNRSKEEGDLNLSGDIDGSDLLDMSLMMHRNIVFGWGGGQYFYPNGSYQPRFDLNTDGIIDESDLELFTNAAYGLEETTSTESETEQ